MPLDLIMAATDERRSVDLSGNRWVDWRKALHMVAEAGLGFD